MNFKLIHIRYRFLIQIILFVVYLAILIGLAFHLNKISDLDRNISHEIISFENKIAETQTSYFTFLNNVSSSDQFYREGENDNTLKFLQAISVIEDSIKNLSGNKRMLRRIGESGRSDTLLLSLELYATNFSQTALALREIGSRNSGNIMLLGNISDQIIDSLKQTNIPELFVLGMQIKNLEAKYIAAANPTSFNELNSWFDELINHPSLISTDLFFQNEISNLTQQYRKKLNTINDVYQRLGAINENASLYGEMALSYKDVVKNYKLFRSELTKINARLKQSTVLFIALIILIFTIIYIGFILHLYSRIKVPLTQSIDYSYHLAKGKLKIPPLSTEYSFEFSKLHQNLIRIFDSLQEKKNFVEDLLKQKFIADINLQGKNDTFGKTLIALKENMQKARDEQNKYAEENTIRRYQNEGLAKFSDILRNNSDNLIHLSDIFIKEMVRYIEAIQGGLFLLDEEDKNDTLHLKAAFAYNRKKYLNKTIKLGEGLVGTCALEMKTINLTDIPDDYIEITSGLGDVPPNNLLLLPVMHENVLIGVLELASLKPFDSNQILLGENISESLASSIINARANSRTSELLTKSQQQAAEMAEQEEEMRQNMEELKATQEESARREEELEGLLESIDQAFYVIEYDIEGSITKVNQRLLYLLNLKLDKVLGKKHIQIFGKKSKADSLLFASVSDGKTVELVEKVEINKKLLEIRNTFSPVKSKEGNTLKILNIMTVIM